MNEASITMLGALERVHANCFGRPAAPTPDCIRDPDLAGDHIRQRLRGDRPVMMARFGNNELNCVCNYLGVRSGERSWNSYIRGRCPPWWWKRGVIEKMVSNAGFFPGEIDAIERFCELMLRDIPLVDLLASWLPEEALFHRVLRHSVKVEFELINPYFARVPWTTELAGKKVLVVHPFAHSIEAQYRKRELLFPSGLLPAFELRTLKAVQSIAGEKTRFADWFAALDAMKKAMDEIDYDIALIGCGAYGLPLAAHAKRSGKKGFHLGGSLQLLFGIRGKRWENPNYNPHYNYARLINEHWIKPAEEERPRAADSIEGACYW